MLRCLPILLAVILLGLAGCAVSPPPAAPPAAALRATIVAVRPVAPAADGPLLALLGAPSGAVVPVQAREFILRTEDGHILSIVQDDDGLLRAGQAVSVVAGARARLSGS